MQNIQKRKKMNRTGEVDVSVFITNNNGHNQLQLHREMPLNQTQWTFKGIKNYCEFVR